MIQSITSTVTLQHLGSTAEAADLDRYLDALADALEVDGRIHSFEIRKAHHGESAEVTYDVTSDSETGAREIVEAIETQVHEGGNW